jgi:hypothetical protein
MKKLHRIKFREENGSINENNITNLSEQGNNKNHQVLCIEEIAKQNPILTEEEMNNFITYEEIIAYATKMLDDEINKIDQEYAKYKGKQQKRNKEDNSIL